MQFLVADPVAEAFLPGSEGPDRFAVRRSQHEFDGVGRYEAFDVVPGQRLYVEPGARIRIW